ncbi:MAG: hypothetical protein P4L50_13785 [Anaerolineaceae bacterium]|nr:hypothetical protein [Anaerolineaceae bacterium]
MPPGPLPEITPTVNPIPTSTPLPQSEVSFNVQLPPNINYGSIYLDVLDEVTGLALNPTEYAMQKVADAQYTVKVKFASGSIVKYRYVHKLKSDSAPAIEYTSNTKQVRYRLYDAAGSGEVHDFVSAWIDSPYKGPIGQIHGQVFNSVSKAPIPNIMMAAGGFQTITASDGSYILDGLPPGIHNLVAYSLDGSFQPFQQEARVDAGAVTPALLSMTPATLVNVVFVLHTPDLKAGDPPIRMVGNISRLGDTFSDLEGGTSILPTEAKQLVKVGDAQYGINLSLPVGLDLRYKYTFGDGFWNAEQNPDGGFHLRQMIVDGKHPVIQDWVNSWQNNHFGPVNFSVMVPANTPVDDTISIQFRSFDWMEPIPMVKVNATKWNYKLYSPLNLVSNIGYRFCRNEQCGIADDSATRGNSVGGWPFSPGLIGQDFEDEVSNWAWWNPGSGSPNNLKNVGRRDATFWGGIEFLSNYQPSWQPHMQAAIQSAQNTGANWLVLTPTWTFDRINPPVLQLVPGSDPLWPDLKEMADSVHQSKGNVAIFPNLNFTHNRDTWWQNGTRDLGWWQTWFDRYRTFLLNFADFASQNNVGALIIGGPDISPALPGGELTNGSPSGVPQDANDRWVRLINDIRNHYKGQLIWALPYPDGIKNPPAFLSSLDQIYLLWSSGVASGNNPTQTVLTNEIGHELDVNVKPFIDSINKPLIVAIKYPSANGAALGCMATDQNCTWFVVLDQPNTSNPGSQVNLQAQADIYSAFLQAVNQRNWVDGIVSRGYYPPVALQDKSSSIHGKPAYDILQAWFSLMLSQPGS